MYVLGKNKHGVILSLAQILFWHLFASILKNPREQLLSSKHSSGFFGHCYWYGTKIKCGLYNVQKVYFFLHFVHEKHKEPTLKICIVLIETQKKYNKNPQEVGKSPQIELEILMITRTISNAYPNLSWK